MVFYPSDLLCVKTREVKDIDGNIENIVLNMIELMDSNHGVGLATPQVGLDLSLFVTREMDTSRPLVFINPVILSTSYELNTYKEGCLSIPGVFNNLERPKTVLVQAYDLRGKLFKIENSGFLARIIQHEMDHLKGILFIDYYDEKLREKLLKNYFKKKKGDLK